MAVFIDIVGRDPVRGFVFCDGQAFSISYLAEEEIASAISRVTENSEIVTDDLRKLLSVGLDLSSLRVFDVCLLHGGERAFFRTCQRVLAEDEIKDLNDASTRYKAHAKAIATSGIDLSQHNIRDVIPNHFLDSFFGKKATAALKLFDKTTLPAREEFLSDVLPLSIELWNMERNGILIDDGTNTDKVLTRSRFNPVGSRTSRIRVEGGFQCMSIPKAGSARSTIVSRFEGGKILSIDYNAMDYRCLISQVSDKSFRSHFDSHSDFHEATLSLLFPGVEASKPMRDIVKYLTYIYLYGGSESAISEKLSIKLSLIRKVMDLLSERLSPLMQVKLEIVSGARKIGYVETPMGQKVHLKSGDHDGAIIGLYAQTFSAGYFNRAIISLGNYLKDKKSLMMFPVHDEIVIDLHPDDERNIPDMISIMEDPGLFLRFRCSAKIGSNYGNLEKLAQ